jgi:hypothetical protein
MLPVSNSVALQTERVGRKKNMAGSMRHSAKHPGFASAQNKIAKKQGISQDRAGSILAAASRNSSKAAHKANPRLNRVKG